MGLSSASLPGYGGRAEYNTMICLDVLSYLSPSRNSLSVSASFNSEEGNNDEIVFSTGFEQGRHSREIHLPIKR